MVEALLVALLLLHIAALALLAVLLFRTPGRAGQDSGATDASASAIERFDRVLREELAIGRGEGAVQARAQREELSAALRSQADSLVQTVGQLAAVQQQRLDSFAQSITKLVDSNEVRSEALRSLIDSKLTAIQLESSQKLDEMRATVNDRLQGVLEQRLSESFKLVSERLELVHRGLGEMQSLAAGVGDLKRVLTNVKTRGTWGEIQLGNLLEDVLLPEQFARNIAPVAGREVVEFALRLPGHTGDSPVYLPIDAKFPRDDYERMVAAQERGDGDAAEQAARQLEARLHSFGRDIRQKYVCPPATTDFAILFLPTESLYAEVLRRPGLIERLQRECKVNVAGPTTLAALLNSLQMGFQTLAIQKRSSEVWSVLGNVRMEFSKFADVLAKVQKKLGEASSAMDAIGTRTRVLQRRLRGVDGVGASKPTPDLTQTAATLFPGRADD